MSQKKPFLLRLSPEMWAELRRMAAEEFRSINGQIEFILAEAFRARGRRSPAQDAGPEEEEPPER